MHFLRIYDTPRRAYRTQKLEEAWSPLSTEANEMALNAFIGLSQRQPHGKHWWNPWRCVWPSCQPTTTKDWFNEKETNWLTIANTFSNHDYYYQQLGSLVGLVQLLKPLLASLEHLTDCPFSGDSLLKILAVSIATFLTASFTTEAREDWILSSQLCNRKRSLGCEEVL